MYPQDRTAGRPNPYSHPSNCQSHATCLSHPTCHGCKSLSIYTKGGLVFYLCNRFRKTVGHEGTFAYPYYQEPRPEQEDCYEVLHG